MLTIHHDLRWFIDRLTWRPGEAVIRKATDEELCDAESEDADDE